MEISKCVYCQKEIGTVDENLRVVSMSYYRNKWSFQPVCSLECKTKFETEKQCQVCSYWGDDDEPLFMHNGKAYCHDKSFKGAFCNEAGMTHFEAARGCKKCHNLYANIYQNLHIPIYDTESHYYCGSCTANACTLCRSQNTIPQDDDSSDDNSSDDKSSADIFFLCPTCVKFLREHRDNIKLFLKLYP